jgi:hypothetical protein
MGVPNDARGMVREMKRRDYLRKLRRTAREHDLVPFGNIPYPDKPRTPAKMDYLVHVMRECGFTDDQIVEKREAWARGE